MSKMIQVRNVPADLHRKLKARAAMEGRSLSDLVLDEIRRVAERPTMQEMLERIARRPRVDLKVSAADLIREDRDSR